jgi:hypothetical protein
VNGRYKRRNTGVLGLKKGIQNKDISGSPGIIKAMKKCLAFTMLRGRYINNTR